MPHVRKSDQKVEAFSAPKSLLKEATEEAIRRKMTKSGFFRYCLAKELGYSEQTAADLAMHGTIQNLQKSQTFEDIRGKASSEANLYLNENNSVLPPAPPPPPEIGKTYAPNLRPKSKPKFTPGL